jgi:hypothetical protein
MGQTLTQAMQSMQSPFPRIKATLGQLAARLAAPVAIGDGDRVLVHHRGLNARPGAGIDADLFAAKPPKRKVVAVRTAHGV